MSRHPCLDELAPTPGAIVSYRPIGSSDSALMPTGVVMSRMVRGPGADERWVVVQRPVSADRARLEWINVACIVGVIPLPA